MDQIGRALLQVLVALDQLANALLLGWADETLSSRSYRSWKKGQRYFGWIMHAIDAIFFWQDGHCRIAYEAERKRAQLPPGLRDAD